MQILPYSKEQWFDLVLLPAKAWLIIFAVVINLRLPLGDSTLSEIGFTCFILSGPFLLLGALFQGFYCQRGSAARTLMFLAILTAIIYSTGRWGVGGILVVLPGWLTWRFIRSYHKRKPPSEDPIECLECHAIVPAGEPSCSHCGWTFKS